MSAPKGTVWRISIRVPDTATDAFETAFQRFAGAVSSQARVDDPDWMVEGYADAEPDRKSVETAVAALARDLELPPPKVRFDLEPTVDWLTQNLQSFPPVIWGRYWIAGTHLEDRCPPGKVPLRIDAGTAFGSGEHPTTGGCLTMIDGLAKRRRHINNVLDLGCGSGILGIAASKTWGAAVTASDIDPESVRVTRRHAAINGVGHAVKAVASAGYGNAVIGRAAPFDLIIANILARPLAQLAHDLGRHLAPDGVAIISGLLTRDGPWMASSHRHAGLHIAKRIEIDGWLTLMLCR
ncbi:MAG: 50S ribosomal protein L11 methyltransferase [Rhodospirillales bacterium]